MVCAFFSLDRGVGEILQNFLKKISNWQVIGLI